MLNKVSILFSATLLIIVCICCGTNYGYSQTRPDDNGIMENISYTAKRDGPITENIINNFSYKIRPYDPDAQENSKYELVKFTKGEGYDGTAFILNIAIGNLSENKSVKSAVFILSADSGGNSTETQLCIVSDSGNEYHINQAIIFHNKWDEIKSIKIQNNEIILSDYSRLEKTKHPKFCTTRYRLNNDKIEKIK